MIRILHCADAHIDTPFSGCFAKEAKSRRDALMTAFSKTVEAARYARVQLFLIAGDLFDSATVDFNTLSALAREMGSLPECKFVIAPGNHDPYISGGAYDATEWPSNVYIFKSKEVSKFSFDELGVDVYGYAFEDSAMRECPLENFMPDDLRKLNIVVAHGDTEDMFSNYCPIRTRLLDSLPVDYAALGHIHKGANDYNGGKYAYSGCLSGRALDETGKKGFIIGELDKGSRKMRFCPLSGKRFEIASLDVTPYATEKEIDEAVYRLVKSYDADTTLRLVLKGNLTSELESYTVKQNASDEVEKLETVDETVSQIAYSDLADNMTVKGAVFAKLRPYLESDDKNLREKGKLALKYVLSALSGQNDFT